jgi:hypothetical protein
MSTDDAMAIYTYHLHRHALVNKYREFKNSNRNLKRIERDWWFPILKTTVSKMSAAFLSGRNGCDAQSRELKKVYSPDLATAFGINYLAGTYLLFRK